MRQRAEAVTSRYTRRGKRLLDLVLVVASAPLTVPLLALGWLSVRLTGGTPVFRQRRVGRDLEPFVLLKLRTMRPANGDGWTPVTVRGDARVTPLGRGLRRAKLDELPQLWNVLRGEMTLVGPRPEVPCYVAGLTDAFRQSLVVPPGLTGLTSLVFLDEAARLSSCTDVDEGYRSVILPQKLVLDALYAQHISLRLDLHIIGLTALAVVAPDAARRRAASLATGLTHRRARPLEGGAAEVDA